MYINIHLANLKPINLLPTKYMYNNKPAPKYPQNLNYAHKYSLRNPNPVNHLPIKRLLANVRCK